MNTDIFDKMKDSKKKELYTKMWSDNPVVKTASVEKTLVSKDKNGKLIYSDNSFSFADHNKDKVSSLMDVFGIEDRKLFKIKYKMACSGSGQEGKRITTLHSSSLCALLFFYNVTEKNPLIVDGIGRFTESVFEFQSPVITNSNNKNGNSCMDVVLVGKNENGDKDIVLFLESKFSEYYTSASKSLYTISKKYLINEYSEVFYNDEFLSELMLSRADMNEENEYSKDKEVQYFKLSSEDKFYIGGIKQMISHYVGIRNILSGNFAEHKNEENEIKERIEEVEKIISDGAKIYLAEIVFDSVIGDFKLGKANGKTYKKAYSEKYEKLAEKMNDIIAESNLADRFHVITEELGYKSLFLKHNPDFKLDKNVRVFYFGN